MASVPAELEDALASTTIWFTPACWPSRARGHALGADLVAALGAEQRPLGTVPSGRRSDEAGMAAGADGFLSPVHFRWRASSDLLAAELGP